MEIQLIGNWDDDGETGLSARNKINSNFIALKDNKADLVEGKVPTEQLPSMAAHEHDDRYYTETEIDALISGTNNPVYKGDIALATDFPLSGTVTKYDQYTVTAAVTDNNATRTNTGLSFVDGDEIYWTGTTWELIGNIDIPLKKVYINQTYTIAGEVKVAIGQTDAIIPFSMPVLAGTAAKIVKLGYSIGSGTNAAFKLQRNGVDIAAIGTKTATTTYATATFTAVGLANMDKLQAVVTSVSGTPTNLGIDIIIEITL